MNDNRRKISIDEVLNITNGSKNPLDVHKALFEDKFYNTMFANIGLSNEYTEDDLDVLDDYFRNKRGLYSGLDKQSVMEAISRYPFALYLAKIFEVNNEKVEIVYKHDKKEIDYSLEIHLKDQSNIILFPMVKLGRIAFSKNRDSDVNLMEWYSMSVITYKNVKLK